MSKKDFEEYLKKQHTNADEKAEIDWNKERDEWLSYLDQFYKKIKAFLKDHTDSGDLSVESPEKTIQDRAFLCLRIFQLNMGL